MKYIITESQFNKVIENYLDTKYESWYFSDIGDGEFTIYDGKKPIIKYRINPSNLNELIIIAPSLVLGLSELFGIEETESGYHLKNWLNTNFDTNVEYLNWDYEMDDDYYDGQE